MKKTTTTELLLKSIASEYKNKKSNVLPISEATFFFFRSK